MGRPSCLRRESDTMKIQFIPFQQKSLEEKEPQGERTMKDEGEVRNEGGGEDVVKA